MSRMQPATRRPRDGDAASAPGRAEMAGIILARGALRSRQAWARLHAIFWSGALRADPAVPESTARPTTATLLLERARGWPIRTKVSPMSRPGRASG
jgi:hypothetical protein